MSLLQSNFEWSLSNGEKILRGAKSGFIQALPVFFVFFLFIYLFIFFWGGVWTLAWMVCGTYFQGLYRVLICRYYSNQQNMAWKQVPVWGQGGFFLKNGFPYTISTPPLPLWYGSKNVTILIFCKDWQFSKVSRTTSSSPWYDGLPLQI